MRSGIAVLGVWMAAAAMAADPVPMSLRIEDETAPPGGVAQIRFVVTEPKPIITGRVDMLMDGEIVGEVLGVAAHSVTGDVHGVAMVDGRRVAVTLSSPRGTFGLGPEYPVLALTVSISPAARPGASWQIGARDVQVNWRDLAGDDYALEFKPGTLRVGGSMYVGNVVPGGGAIAAGTPFAVLGGGFLPQARLQMEGVEMRSFRVVDGTRIEGVAAVPFRMDGTRVRVRNPDEEDVYFAYHRRVPVGRSAHRLLARAEPLYPADGVRRGTLRPVIDGPGYATGISVENLSAPAANVRLTLYDALSRKLGEAAVALPYGMQFTRSVEELFPGAAGRYGGFVTLEADAEVRALLLALSEDGPVAPLRAVSAEP